MTYTSILALTTLLILSACASNDVIIRDLKMFVDNTEFIIEAVAYNPVPLGLANASAQYVGGSGYCSVLEDMWGEWKSACYDSDYFSGALGSPGSPSPADGWFTNIWQRDFPIIKAMGANTLRIYNANPATRNATITYSNIFLYPYGKDHTSFMDYAQQFGLMVIFPLIGDATIMLTSDPNEYRRYLMWQIDEVGNHPALLAYTLGNELDLDADPALLALVNEYIGFARSYMLLRWNRVIPITSAVVDLPQSYNYLARELNVDFFTSNAGYRGVSFTDLWSGDSQNNGWFSLSCQYNKPLFIGEIGWQDDNNAIMSSIPNWFNQIWGDGINHIPQGCIGGTFFEYSDEPLKPELQQTMGVVTFVPSIVDGISSLTAFAWNPDTAIIKSIYQYVANGTANGVPSNFNADVFSILGRSPYTLSTLPSTGLCQANFTITTCPTKSTFFDCSGHGNCDQFVGSCMCMSGWSGSDCSVPVCNASCSGHGTCVSTVSPPICSCDSGYDGDICQNAAPSGACPIGSGALTACGDGNGICNNSTWTCDCISGWTGLACTTPTGASADDQTTASATAPASTQSSGAVPPTTQSPSSTESSPSNGSGATSAPSGSSDAPTSAPVVSAHTGDVTALRPAMIMSLLLVVVACLM